MRRISVLAILVALVGLGTIGHGAGTGAHDGTPVAAAGHPLVGTWIINIAGETPSVTTFDSDGTVVDVEADATLAGAWEATGPRTANATFAGFVVGEGFGASVVVRVALAVDGAGDALTADYSFTAVAADGTVLESGRGAGTGVRMAVEPVEAEGTPLAGLDPWTVPGAQASPEAGSGGVVIVQVVAEDGVTPVSGACLELTGPAGTYAACDNGGGDLDPTDGFVELDGVAPGEYALAVVPPAGFGGTEEVAVVVEAGGARMVTLALAAGGAPPTPLPTAPPTPTSTMPPTPTSTMPPTPTATMVATRTPTA